MYCFLLVQYLNSFMKRTVIERIAQLGPHPDTWLSPESYAEETKAV